MARFSKLVFLVMAGLLVFAAAANATTTRILSLGGFGISNYVADDVNQFNWYAPLTQYGDMAWVEFGDFSSPTSTTSQAFGIANNCFNGKYGTWAVWLQQEVSSPWFYDATSVVPGVSVGGETTFTKWVLRWAMDFDAVTIGFGFDRQDQETQTDPTLENNRSETGYGGGVRIALGDNASLEAAATYGTSSYKRDWDLGAGNVLRIEDDDNTSFDIRGRIFYDWTDDTQLVPFVSFLSRQLSLQSDSSAVTDALEDPTLNTNLDETVVVLGLGVNQAVNGDNMLFFGLEVESKKVEPSRTTTLPTPNPELKYVTLPRFYAALESGVTDWLTARAGAVQSLTRLKDENDVTITSGVTELFLGVGFKLSDFDFDVLLADYAPYQFGYFLTGFQNGAAPVLRITGSYHY